MDPFRMVVRCLMVYVVLLLLLRLAGKRTIRQGTAFDLVLSLILGDLVDDAILAEVPIAEYVVASCNALRQILLTLHQPAGQQV